MPTISKIIIGMYVLLAVAQANLLLPDGYYDASLPEMDLREIAELPYTTPTIADQEDCSIKCTFLEWAFENNGIPATFCYKMTHQDGADKTWHVWLRVQNGSDYVYVDPTQEKENVILTPEYSVWNWYNSSDHIECEDLPSLCTSTEQVISKSFNQVWEFAWWRFGNLSLMEYELTTGTKIQRV